LREDRSGPVQAWTGSLPHWAENDIAGDSLKPRIEAIRIVDMSSSNGWAEFAGVFARTREVYLEHEQGKTELKGLMPEDANEAIGHGVWAKRSRSGAVSFDLLSGEVRHAPLQ